jgi:ATP-dependent helicase HrpA
MRLERLPNNLKRDTDAVAQLDPLMMKLGKRENEAKLAEFRWGLEELRISLFAQPMKTLYPVSVKRLEKLWADANG